MEMTSCRSLRDAVVAFLDQQIEATTVNDKCIITLPLKTLDDRFVDVYIERRLGPNVLVHDGGKTMAELFAQGIHLTDSQELQMKGIARRNGAVYQHGMFQIAATLGETLQESVLALAQCITLAMMPVLSHTPVIEDEPLSGRVARSLFIWRPPYVDIERNKTVKGRRKEHRFDFISHARKADARTVAIKLLPPGYGPNVQADRYGFLAYDLESRIFDRWRRLAIIARVEEWTRESLDIVRSLSADTIELETDAEQSVELVLPRKMTELTEAA